MKLVSDNGEVCLRAETVDDVAAMIVFLREHSDAQKGAALPAAEHERRWKKACDVCGKKYRSVKIHKMRAHEGHNWSRRGRRVPINVPFTAIPV